MINPVFILAIGVASIIYTGINYYIGLRGWQSIGSHLSFVPHNLYWMIFWVIALSYLAGRLGEKLLPAGVNNWLTVLGSYWLGFMFYFLLTLVAIDFIRGLDYFLHFIPGWLKYNSNPAFGLVILVFVTTVVAYGTWNSRYPVVQHYALTIKKPAGNLKQMRIAMVSDIHLGTLVGNSQLDNMVVMLNSLKPDLILFAGDVIDESVEPFVEAKMADRFSQLKAKYGVYSVLGNHEYIGGNGDEIVKYLHSAGVGVLRDQTVKVANSFYIVGREDMSGQRFSGKKRQDLATLLAGVDRRLPILVLDHQPSHLDEPENQGVDLQLSGHTHRGQLFPNQLITQRIFEDDWGLMQKGPFNLIVSSGFGTWGPPIRVGNKPEVVDIVVNFASNS